MRRLLIAALFTLSGCATAASRTAIDIDRYVNDVLRTTAEAPSLGIAVVQDGHVVYLHEPDSGYYIGSATKGYTALACAILAQRGQLDLDVPVRKYVPELNLSATLRSFLTHTSGLENNAVEFRTAYTGEYTPQLLLQLLNTDTKHIATSFQYENLGYIVASFVIERITGKPWQKALDDLVFTPLGMNHTTAYMSEAQQWPMKPPYVLDRNGNMAITSFVKTDRTMHAAGGIVTTPSDLAKWLDAVMMKRGGGIPRAAFEEVERMQVPVQTQRGDFKASGYGFGWYQADFKGEKALFHAGAFPGWGSFYSVLPDRHMAVGVMSNATWGVSSAVILGTASFIYDEMLGKGGDPDTRAAALSNSASAAIIADRAKRAQRPWMLKHPNEAYVGRYENAGFGTMVIEQQGDHLVARLSNLHSVLEPFTQPESARVELVPDSGDVLRFEFNGGDKPVAVKFGDDRFVRVD